MTPGTWIIALAGINRGAIGRVERYTDCHLRRDRRVLVRFRDRAFPRDLVSKKITNLRPASKAERLASGG